MKGTAPRPVEYSWPAAYVRDGVTGGAAPSRRMYVTLTTATAFNGSLNIRAVSDAGLEVVEQQVSFSGGRAADVAFTLRGLPSTAGWLSGVGLEWHYRGGTPGNDFVAQTTHHTFFVLDSPPLPADLRGLDRYLFEVLDWACRWAHGRTGPAAVLNAIWSHFTPVRAAHDTGLVYWKNWRLGISPAQDIAAAVRSQDDPDALRKNAASCIVFDRIFINCLSAHGIRASEIQAAPHPTTTFSRGPNSYMCDGWNATSVVGQGNTAAPPAWCNHWIANVQMPTGQWRTFDASYGAGPVDSNDPTSNDPVDLSHYEPLGLRSFRCEDLATGLPAAVPRNPDPAVPPHLVGHVLWTP